jgi:hypothetical protein
MTKGPNMPSVALTLCLIFPLIALPLQGYCAEQLLPGDTFPGLQAEDQHGNPYLFSPGTAAVLIAFDMKTGKRANKFFAEQGADFLPDQNAVYIANIYVMPGIGRMFALPKMRKYPHRIVLAQSQDLLLGFPHKADHITIIKLNEKGVVASIDYWQPNNAWPTL